MPLGILRNRFRCRSWQWRKRLWMLAKPRLIIYIRRFIYFCLVNVTQDGRPNWPNKIWFTVSVSGCQGSRVIHEPNIHHHLSGDTCCASWLPSWLPSQLIDLNFILAVYSIHGKHSFLDFVREVERNISVKRNRNGELLYNFSVAHQFYTVFLSELMILWSSWVFSPGIFCPLGVSSGPWSVY